MRNVKLFSTRGYHWDDGMPTLLFLGNEKEAPSYIAKKIEDANKTIDAISGAQQRFFFMELAQKEALEQAAAVTETDPNSDSFEEEFGGNLILKRWLKLEITKKE